jgi:DNA-binding NtrC family response regulator
MESMSETEPKVLLVYVVDDNALLGQITAQIIATDGHATRFFKDPEEARHALTWDEPPPDLLVTDFDLGPIHGLELIAAARKRNAHIKSMVVSGTVEERFLENYTTKPDKFLPKPFRADDLLSGIDELMRA